MRDPNQQAARAVEKITGPLGFGGGVVQPVDALLTLSTSRIVAFWSRWFVDTRGAGMRHERQALDFQSSALPTELPSRGLSLWTILSRRQASGPGRPCLVTGKLPRQFQGLVEKMKIKISRDFFRPELFEMRGEPLRVEQGEAPGPQPLDQGPERDFGGAAHTMEHRLAEERAADRHSIEAAHQLVARPRFDGMRAA